MPHDQLSLLDLKPTADPAPVVEVAPTSEPERSPFRVGDRVQVVYVVMHSQELVGLHATVYEVLKSVVRIRTDEAKPKEWTIPYQCLKLAPSPAQLWLESGLRYYRNLQAKFIQLQVEELKARQKTHLFEVRKREISRLQEVRDRLSAEIEDLKGGAL